MQLFFENGYEATSVRMILNQVNGEVGMFYHYFKSKEELFQDVVERFFSTYSLQFIQLTKICVSPEEFVNHFLSFYETSMQRYHTLSGNMHWTIQYAMAAKTIEGLLPALMALLNKWGYDRREPADIVAGQLLYGMSASLHSDSFISLLLPEKRGLLLDLFGRLL